MKALKFMLLLMGISLGTLAYSETIFVQYDVNCMDRYEYRYTGAGHGHIAYHIRKNDREKIILEVGLESKVVRPDRPTNVKTCREISINEKLVREINNGDAQVYFVRRVNNGYNVSPVGIATYTQISPTFVGFTSVDHKFVYNFAQPAGDQNLALNNSESQVFYRGVIAHNCPRKYQFERMKKRAGRSYAEMVVIPEIGVIEERVGFNKTDAENNRLELIAINGMPIDQYINDFCGQQGFDNAMAGTFYSTRRYATGGSNRPTNGGGTVVDLENGKRPTTSTPTTRPNNGGSTTSTGSGQEGDYQFKCNYIYKDIDKGLYIDRNTGQAANTSCGGVTYRNGYRADDGSPVIVGPNQPTNTTPNVPPVVVDNGSGTVAEPPRPSPCGEYSGNGYHIVQQNETLYGIAQLYGLPISNIKNWNGLRSNLIKPCMKLYVRPKGTSSPSSQPSADDVLVSRGDNGGVHIVQRNETLYGIAKKYGYTTAKLRQMNGLGPNDVIFVNQRLKTSDCNCPSPKSGNVAVNNRPSTANIPVAAEFISEKNVPASYNFDGSKRRVHIVKDEETIYSIARAYNVSPSRLRQINNLEENEIIIPYQRLYVE
ncbi:MAG: LysM peptidoglycan-binding domain-containing protein [Bacteroidota bacterium]